MYIYSKEWGKEGNNERVKKYGKQGNEIKLQKYEKGIKIKKRDRQYTYNVTSRRDRVTIVAGGNAESITYSECVFVALIIQQPKRTRRTAIRGLSGTTIFFHITS